MSKEAVRDSDEQNWLLRTWKARIREEERVDPLAPTAAAGHVGRHQRVLLRRDVVDHLAVGEEGHIEHGVERARVGAAAVAHLRPEDGLGDVLRVVGVPAAVQAELAVDVVDAVLLLVSVHARAPCLNFETRPTSVSGRRRNQGERSPSKARTFEALVAGAALRARLRALAALVLVAWAADGEGALVARHEGLPVEAASHVVVAAYLTGRLRVRRPARRAGLAADHHELVPVVRAGDQPRARLHRRRDLAGARVLFTRASQKRAHDAATSVERAVVLCSAG
jgi:hypothetical protein